MATKAVKTPTTNVYNVQVGDKVIITVGQSVTEHEVLTVTDKKIVISAKSTKANVNKMATASTSVRLFNGAIESGAYKIVK